MPDTRYDIREWFEIDVSEEAPIGLDGQQRDFRWPHAGAASVRTSRQHILEDAEDALAVRRWREQPGETVPAEIVDRLLDGENKIKVWRMHRGMTQQALADSCGISKPYVSQLEAGSRLASQGVLRKLAAALRVDLDDLA